MIHRLGCFCFFAPIILFYLFDLYENDLGLTIDLNGLDLEEIYTKSWNLKYPFCDNLFENQILRNSSFPVRAALPSKEWINSPESFDQAHLSNLADDLKITKGGCWTPKSYCQVRESVAYLVPYRDRQNNAGQFLDHMHRFLQKQHREYCIVLVEQADKGMFNRAKLLNVGYSKVRL